ncbi:hypothetical protein M0R45_036127 [Rubus argutus]|uniref:Uncharacterized protein n=1 Tax=Rubus argutus TaxID=59490 RepID=A0AAW1VW70_RUBAR
MVTQYSELEGEIDEDAGHEEIDDAGDGNRRHREGERRDLWREGRRELKEATVKTAVWVLWLFVWRTASVKASQFGFGFGKDGSTQASGNRARARRHDMTAWARNHGLLGIDDGLEGFWGWRRRDTAMICCDVEWA